MIKPKTPRTNAGQTAPHDEAGDPTRMSHYLVTTPSACFTWIGKVQADTNGHCLLCAPNGRPLFKVPTSCVTRTTAEETAQRIVKDRQIEMARRN